MKKDFSKRELPSIVDKVGLHTDCNCFDCQKSQHFNAQYAQRLSPFRSAVQVTKNNHFLEPHSDSVDSSVIGKYVYSKLPINVYNEMGGSIYKVRNPPLPAGKVIATNKAGTWLYVTFGGYDGTKYVYASKDLEYRDGGDTVLTDKQKKDIVFSALGSSVGSTNPVAGIAVDAAKVGSETAGKIGDSIATFLGAAKWYLIAVLVLVIIGVFLRIKNG